MNLLQQLQNKHLTIIESIEDNLGLILNSFNIIDSFGIDIFDINETKKFILHHEPRINIIDIKIDKYILDILYEYNGNIRSTQCNVKKY